MKKIGEGETAEVFRIEPGIVVKLFRNEFYDEESFQNEFYTVKYVGEHTGLAPKVFEKIQLHGRYGYTMEEVTGTLFQDEIDQKPEKLSCHAKLLGEAQRLLHGIPDTGGLINIPHMKNDAAKFLDFQAVFPEHVGVWLKRLFTSLPGDCVLLHGDFMPYNIIITDDRLHILDWAEPAFGHPMLGVARTLNCIADPTDYADSLYTHHAPVFIKHYLDAYFHNEKPDSDALHACLLLNAAFEYRWAVMSHQSDAYTLRTKEFILKNFADYGSDTLIALSNGTDVISS